MRQRTLFTSMEKSSWGHTYHNACPAIMLARHRVPAVRRTESIRSTDAAWNNDTE